MCVKGSLNLSVLVNFHNTNFHNNNKNNNNNNGCVTYSNTESKPVDSLSSSAAAGIGNGKTHLPRHT